MLQSNVIKYEEERVCRENYQKLMNEENPGEGRNEQQAEVEDDITEITSAELQKALRKTNNWKEATGSENVPLEVWKIL